MMLCQKKLNVLDEYSNKETNYSLPFDIRLWKQEIKSSMAYAKLLKTQGALDDKEYNNIVTHLQEILWDGEANRLNFNSDEKNIHAAIQHLLAKRIGDSAKKISNGRSLQGQAVISLKLYQKEAINKIVLKLSQLVDALSAQQDDTLLCFANMFMRDISRFNNCLERTDFLPANNFLDKKTEDKESSKLQFIMDELGFKNCYKNKDDFINDRDFIIEFAGCCSMTMMHISNLCEDLSTNCSNNSSVLANVKNKSGRVYGNLVSLLTTMDGMSFMECNDITASMEPMFDAYDTVLSSLKTLRAIICN